MKPYGYVRAQVGTRVLPESIYPTNYAPDALFPTFVWARKSHNEQPRPVSAILVLHDPLDWALEVQVVVDVLRGGNMFLTACQKRSHSECHVVCTPKRKTWGANLKGLTPRVNGAFPASAGTRGTLVHMGQISTPPSWP